MQNEIKSRENATIELQLIFDKKEVEPVRNSTYRNYQRHLNLNGFRRGKVPFKVAQRLLGKDFLTEEITQNLLDSNLEKAIDDLDLTINSQIYIDSFQLNDDGTIEVVVKFGTSPDIQILPEGIDIINSTEGFEPLDFSDEVIQDKLNTRIDSLIEDVAEKTSVEKPVEKGDYVALDILSTNSFKPVPKQLYLTIGKNHPILPVAAQETLLGKETGNELTLINEEMDETFNVKIADILTFSKPEYTDEWVAANFIYDNKKDLEDYLKAIIKDEMVSQTGTENGPKIFDKIFDKTNVIISDLTVNELKNNLSEELIEYLEKENKVFAQAENKEEAYLDYYKRLLVGGYLSNLLGAQMSEAEQTDHLLFRNRLVNKNVPDFSESDSSLISLFAREMVLDGLLDFLGRVNVAMLLSDNSENNQAGEVEETVESDSENQSSETEEDIKEGEAVSE